MKPAQTPDQLCQILMWASWTNHRSVLQKQRPASQRPCVRPCVWSDSISSMLRGEKRIQQRVSAKNLTPTFDDFSCGRDLNTWKHTRVCQTSWFYLSYLVNWHFIKYLKLEMILWLWIFFNIPEHIYIFQWRLKSHNSLLKNLVSMSQTCQSHQYNFFFPFVKLIKYTNHHLNSKPSVQSCNLWFYLCSLFLIYFYCAFLLFLYL